MSSLYSRRIHEILTSCERYSQRIVMLLDEYDCAESRDEFVAALVYRLLVEQARNRAASLKLCPPKSSTF